MNHINHVLPRRPRLAQLLLLNIAAILLSCRTTLVVADDNVGGAGAKQVAFVADDFDLGSILLADYIASNRREEAVYENYMTTLSLLDEERANNFEQTILTPLRKLNREKEQEVTKLAVYLFDPYSKSSKEQTELVIYIYGQEQRGTTGAVTDSEGNIDQEKFRQWYDHKLRLWGELKEKQRKIKLDKKMREITKDFEQKMLDTQRSYDDSLRAWHERQRQADRWTLAYLLLILSFVFWIVLEK